MKWDIFYLAKSESPTGVETEKVSISVLGSTYNFITTKDITKDKVVVGSNNA